MSSLTNLTIADAREKLGKGEFSAVELTMAHLHAIEALNPRLNAYVTVSHARAVDQARAADAALAAGDARALTGIRFESPRFDTMRTLPGFAPWEAGCGA